MPRHLITDAYERINETSSEKPLLMDIDVFRKTFINHKKRTK